MPTATPSCKASEQRCGVERPTADGTPSETIGQNATAVSRAIHGARRAALDIAHF